MYRVGEIIQIWQHPCHSTKVNVLMSIIQMIFGDAGLVTLKGKRLKLMSISSLAVQIFFTETVCGSNTFCAFPPATLFTVKQAPVDVIVGGFSQ